MRVSVLIATYNYADFLAEALDSALTQTVPVDEIIVLDDGSTDGTPEILQEYASRESRVRLLRTQNGGLSRARNRLMEAATGDVFSFLDADDRWWPEKWEVERGLLRAEPSVGALFCNFRRFGAGQVYKHDQFHYYPELAHVNSRSARAGQGRVIEEDPFSQLLTFKEMPGWGNVMTFRRDAIKGLLFESSMQPSEDLHFCFRAYRRTAVGYLAAPLVDVRRHGRNESGSLGRLHLSKLRALRDLRAESLTGVQARVLEQRLAGQVASALRYFGAAGDWRTYLNVLADARRHGLGRAEAGRHAVLLPVRLMRGG